MEDKQRKDLRDNPPKCENNIQTVKGLRQSGDKFTLGVKHDQTKINVKSKLDLQPKSEMTPPESSSNK